jgi:hypothetical protein
LNQLASNIKNDKEWMNMTLDGWKGFERVAIDLHWMLENTTQHGLV